MKNNKTPEKQEIIKVQLRGAPICKAKFNFNNNTDIDEKNKMVEYSELLIESEISSNIIGQTQQTKKK